MSDSESSSRGGGVSLKSKPSHHPTAPKRKREDDPDTEQKTKKGSKRKRRTKKPKDIAEEDLDEKLGVNVGLSRMDPRLLSDYVAQRTKRFESELSLVELEDRYIPENAIRDTSDWDTPRIADNLASFITHFSPKKSTLTVAPSTPGSPHTLVITSAGLRAADVVRSLRSFQTKEGKVEKLFAKHIKLKEAIESCGKVRMNFGVGTPQRVADLIEAGALKVDELRRLVVDASHIDAKKRGLLDMKEVQVPLVKLLTMSQLEEKYGVKNGVELLFY